MLMVKAHALNAVQSSAELKPEICRVLCHVPGLVGSEHVLNLQDWAFGIDEAFVSLRQYIFATEGEKTMHAMSASMHAHGTRCALPRSRYDLPQLRRNACGNYHRL